MRMPRIFVDADLAAGAGIVLPAAQSHYLTRVLRLVPGSRLVLFNGDGADYAAEIASRAREGLEVRVEARLPAIPRSPLSVMLVQGLSRGERMDFALQKATELGVAAVQPVSTARSEVRIEPAKLERRMSHWRSVIVSACEQCGRAELPLLHAPLALHAWVGREAAGLRLLLDPGAETALPSLEVPPVIELLVGPEGGFDEAECALLARAGVRAVRLGPRVLRTETAGPAALAVLQAIAGDLA